MRIALAVQQLLPLAHHAHPLVVQDEDLDRQAVLNGRRHLLHGHLHAGVAADVDDQALRVGQLDAHGGGQAVAHGAEPPGGHPAVRLVEVEELGRPHLVLAHFGGDVDILVPGQGVEPLDGVLRLDAVGRGRVAEGLPRPPGLDLPPPLGKGAGVAGQVAGLPDSDQVLQHAAGVADDADVRPDVLGDRGRVDIDMDLARAWREGVELAGDPVVEARADGHHDVAVMHGVVGLEAAVHAQHAQPLVVRGREGAQAHQGRGHRRAGQGGEFPQQGGSPGAGIDHAPAGVEDGPAGTGDHLRRLGDPGRVALGARAVVVGMHHLARPLVGGLAELDVLGDVDDHRSRPPGGGDVEGLVQHPGQVCRVLDQVVVLGDGPGDADGVALLEGVGADQVGGNLAGDDHQGNGIHQGVDDAGDRIGGTRTRRHQDHAGLAGRARIALCGMGRPLFVPDQDVLQARLVEEGIVDGQDRPARIAEQDLNTLVHKGAHDDLSPCQDLCGGVGRGQGLGGHGSRGPKGGGRKRGAWATKRALKGPGNKRPVAADGVSPRQVAWQVRGRDACVVSKNSRNG